MGWLIAAFIYLMWMACVLIWELTWFLIKCALFIVGSLLRMNPPYPWYRWL